EALAMLDVGRPKLDESLELRFGPRLVASVDEKLRPHHAEVGAVWQSLQRGVNELDRASRFTAVSQNPGHQCGGVLVTRLLCQHRRRVVVRLLLAAGPALC